MKWEKRSEFILQVGSSQVISVLKVDDTKEFGNVSLWDRVPMFPTIRHDVILVRVLL